MKRSLVLTVALAAAALAALGAYAQQAAVTVSQKKRAFEPGAVEVGLGDTVLFVNDDGELLHHVFTQDPRFSFDVGEQPAGTWIPVRFTARGTFQVRCEIHPRMLLEVRVR